MSKKIMVNVTQEDIDKGEPGDKYCCPVALALHRMGYIGASVGNDFIRVDVKRPSGRGWDRREFNTPSEVYQFIGMFDHLEPVEPFTFELEV